MKSGDDLELAWSACESLDPELWDRLSDGGRFRAIAEHLKELDEIANESVEVE